MEKKASTGVKISLFLTEQLRGGGCENLNLFWRKTKSVGWGGCGSQYGPLTVLTMMLTLPEQCLNSNLICVSLKLSIGIPSLTVSFHCGLLMPLYTTEWYSFNRASPSPKETHSSCDEKQNNKQDYVMHSFCWITTHYYAAIGNPQNHVALLIPWALLAFWHHFWLVHIINWSLVQPIMIGFQNVAHTNLHMRLFFLTPLLISSKYDTLFLLTNLQVVLMGFI